MSDLTAREQKIETLLSWWIDVLEGWQEGGAGADGLGVKTMSRAYNHPSYRELERCMKLLRDSDAATWWHVRERFQAPRRTVLACPKCGDQCEVAARWFDHRGNVARKHQHGEVVFWVRRTVQVVSEAVRPEVVADGVRWIAQAFRGEPFVPDELLAREKAA